MPDPLHFVTITVEQVPRPIWRRFSTWCAKQDVPLGPALGEALVRFLAAQPRPRKPSTESRAAPAAK
jgi:hypothetical protein